MYDAMKISCVRQLFIQSIKHRFKSWIIYLHLETVWEKLDIKALMYFDFKEFIK